MALFFYWLWGDLVEFIFYLSALIALMSTIFVVTQLDPIHALLNLIVSLLAVAMIFFLLGAPFAGALEVIVYAGAIMVLFVFVVMLLNVGETGLKQERLWLRPQVWIVPAIFSSILLGLLVFLLSNPSDFALSGGVVIRAKQVGIALFGPYLLAVELASILLLAALVVVFHLMGPIPHSARRVAEWERDEKTEVL